jgi:hypothetical protein
MILCLNMRAFLSVLIMCLLPLAACVKHTMVRQAPAFNMADLKRNEIVILPAEAEIYKLGSFNAKERMYDYEEYLQSIISNNLAEILRTNGYKPMLLHKHDIHQQKSSASLLKLRERYAEIMRELYSEHQMPEEKALNIRHNIGGNIMQLPTMPKYIMLCNYHGYSKTNGARTVDFMVDAFLGTPLSASAEEEEMMIAIINQQTGDILWANKSHKVRGAFYGAFKGGKSNDEIDNKHSHKLIEDALAPLINPVKQK